MQFYNIDLYASRKAAVAAALRRRVHFLRVVVPCLMLSLCCAAAGGWWIVRLNGSEAALVAAQEQARRRIEALRGDPEQILVQDIRLYHRLAQREAPWGHILDRMGALLPKSMQFTDVVFDGKEMRVRGFGMAQHQSGELERFQLFVDSLRSDSLYQKFFKNVSINTAQQQRVTGGSISVVDFDLSAALGQPVRQR